MSDKKFSTQKLDSNSSVRMTAISYSYPISAIPTNEQLLGEKRTCAKFYNDISKTETIRRAHRRTWVMYTIQDIFISNCRKRHLTVITNSIKDITINQFVTLWNLKTKPLSPYTKNWFFDSEKNASPLTILSFHHPLNITYPKF